jgi:hypothetical protein
MMLGQQYPDELDALQRRAREMSEQLGIEIIVDHVGVKGGRVIGALKPTNGMLGTVYVAVPIATNKRSRWWRGGDAA